MRGHVRRVPWVDAAEWRAVAGMVLGGDPVDELRAVEHIEAWRARGTLPLAVEATLAVFRARAVDSCPRSGVRASPNPSHESCSKPAEYAVRLMYGMSVVRFVNGFCDAEQKGTTARSVAAIAAELNIPEFVVDVRHQATHMVLPSLSLLRLAAVSTLDWLHENYWSKQEHQLAEIAKQVEGLLLAYREAATRKRGKEKGIKTGKSDRKAEKADILEQLCSAVSPNSVAELVVRPLVKPEMLLPATAGSKGGIASTSAQFDQCYKLWTPAIRHMSRQWPHFTTVLLSALTDIVVTRPKTIQIASSAEGQLRTTAAVAVTEKEPRVDIVWAAAWAEKLLTEFTEAPESLHRTLLRQVLRHPCREFEKFLRILLDRMGPSLESGASDHLLVLFELGCNCPGALLDSPELAKAVADPQIKTEAWTFSSKVLENVQYEQQRRSKTPFNSPWPVEFDPRWRDLPLGLLPTGEGSILSAADMKSTDATTSTKSPTAEESPPSKRRKSEDKPEVMSCSAAIEFVHML